MWSHPYVHTQGRISTNMLQHAYVPSSPMTFRSCSLLSPCGFRGQNSGCQGWQQVSLSRVISPAPELFWIMLFYNAVLSRWWMRSQENNNNAKYHTRNWLRLVATFRTVHTGPVSSPGHVRIERSQLSLTQDLSCLADASERQRTVCIDMIFTWNFKSTAQKPEPHHFTIISRLPKISPSHKIVLYLAHDNTG